MIVTYLPKSARHTDDEIILENVQQIVQNPAGVFIVFKPVLPNVFIENGVEFHVMPDVCA